MRQFLWEYWIDAQEWSQGRPWPLRLAFWVWLAYLFVCHLTDRDYTSIFGGLNLGIHELGHVLFRPFGEFLMIAGGSLLQCLVPLGSLVMFVRQRDYFAAGFAFCWLGTNQYYVATYAADARAMLLPLVSLGGGDPIHDWNYLLSHTGLLGQDQTVAGLIRILAALSFMIGLSWSGLTLWWMVRRPPTVFVDK